MWTQEPAQGFSGCGGGPFRLNSSVQVGHQWLVNVIYRVICSWKGVLRLSPNILLCCLFPLSACECVHTHREGVSETLFSDSCQGDVWDEIFLVYCKESERLVDWRFTPDFLLRALELRVARKAHICIFWSTALFSISGEEQDSESDVSSMAEKTNIDSIRLSKFLQKAGQVSVYRNLSFTGVVSGSRSSFCCTRSWRK